jgi:hypothetical protein
MYANVNVFVLSASVAFLTIQGNKSLTKNQAIQKNEPFDLVTTINISIISSHHFILRILEYVGVCNSTVVIRRLASCQHAACGEEGNMLHAH